MKWTEIILLGVAVFLVQYFLVDLAAIRLIRPDFIAIFVLYTGTRHGRLTGVLTGFILGLLVDLAGVGSYFGLTSLTCSITGYLAGYLKGKYERMLPYVFHLTWIGIFYLHFLIFTYVRYQSVFEVDLGTFWMKWALTGSYSFLFLVVLHFFYSIREASSA